MAGWNSTHGEIKKYIASEDELYKGISFHIEGEWLIIERDNLVKYRGTNEEFDRLFGFQRLRIGTQVEQVKHVFMNRHEGQVKFIKTESKRVLEFPEEYCEDERFAKGER